ncbi:MULTISPECIES: GNAT family N-acetyltransferase [unclassified Streptomyces]|uniref:GNAT family N-acetyltransferase n=1 Tax=unclassified Streptomyces TaxID=2593676 RepID=UPI003436DDCF
MTTPSTSTDTVIRTYGPGQVPALLDVAADIWADAHPELVNNPEAATAGLSVPALRRQITGHLRHEGFTLVIAYSGGTPTGMGYAFPCTATYWFGTDLLPAIPEPARTERLMGLCELAVRRPWQSQGIGTRMHQALITAIAPNWSSLLALPTNDRGRQLYTRLGYQYAGLYRNTPDGPAFDLLLLHVDPA